MIDEETLDSFLYNEHIPKALREELFLLCENGKEKEAKDLMDKLYEYKNKTLYMTWREMNDRCRTSTNTDKL